MDASNSLTRHQLNVELDRLGDLNWAVRARAAASIANYVSTLDARIAELESRLSRAPLPEDKP